MHTTRSAPLFISTMVVALSMGAQAQTAPDAGALQQQIDRQRQQQMPNRITPDKPATPAPMKPAAGATVTVKQFRFAGNTLLSNAQLASAVEPFLNKPLTFNQLQAAAAAVADAYRGAGWIVRVYLPEQDIKDGIVTLQIVEAVFGKFKHEGQRAQRVGAVKVEAYFAAQQSAGQPVNADALDRGLLLADDLPGVAVAGSFAAGSNDRETDLVYKTADEPLLVGEAGLDNTGSRSTGSDRLTLNASFNSPLGIGDLLSTNFIITKGSDYGRLAYTVPVGSDGWRVGANASHMSYKLVADEFTSLHSKGTSDSLGLEASYPILRARLANLYLNLGVDQKRFNNESSGVVQSHYEASVYSATLNGNIFDNLGGGGANSASLGYISGKINLGTLDANETAALNGHFAKIKYSLSRQQVITNNLSLYAAINGQEANKTLDSSEKYYLGGAGGVRAYPANEGGGDSGEIVSVELRWKLPMALSATAFYDDGHVRSEGTTKGYGLKGGGLSLAWQGPMGFNLKTTWAHRNGNNPNPTSAGKDQDGSLHKDRYWLTATLSF